MGVVEEVGPAVSAADGRRPRGGAVQRLCGHCVMCGLGLHSQCETTQVREHGTGASLFGYTELYGAGPGRAGRVPAGAAADFAADQGARRAAGRPLRLPVRRAAHGLAGGAVRRRAGRRLAGRARPRARSATWPRGSRRTSASDRDRRRPGAGAAGAGAPRTASRTIDLREHDDDLGDVVRELTDGRGPDAVIDAVGMEAHGSPVGADRARVVGLLPDAVAASRRCRRRASTGSPRSTRRSTSSAAAARSRSVGVYGGMADPMPMLQMFDKQVQLRMGQANVQALGRRHPAVAHRRRTRWASTTSPRTGCRWPTAPQRLRDVPEEAGRHGQDPAPTQAGVTGRPGHSGRDPGDRTDAEGIPGLPEITRSDGWRSGSSFA